MCFENQQRTSLNSPRTIDSETVAYMILEYIRYRSPLKGRCPTNLSLYLFMYDFYLYLTPWSHILRWPAHWIHSAGRCPGPHSLVSSLREDYSFFEMLSLQVGGDRHWMVLNHVSSSGLGDCHGHTCMAWTRWLGKCEDWWLYTSENIISFLKYGSRCFNHEGWRIIPFQMCSSKNENLHKAAW